MILLKKFVAQFCFICFLSKKGTIKGKKTGGRLLLSWVQLELVLLSIGKLNVMHTELKCVEHVYIKAYFISNL